MGPFKFPDLRPTPPGPLPITTAVGGSVPPAAPVTIAMGNSDDFSPAPANGTTSVAAMQAEREALARALSFVTPGSIPNMPEYGRPAVGGLNDVLPPRPAR